MRRFFTDQILAEGFLEISGAEAKHMQTVVRLNTGDECILVNGRGQAAVARVTDTAKNMLTLQIKEVKQETARNFKLAVLQGYLKERKLDDLIRPLSELGVTEFCAVVTERSVPKPDAKRLDTRLERWRKLAVEALKQCRDFQLMRVCDVAGLNDALAQYKDWELKLLLWEGAETGLHTILEPARQKTPGGVVLLLGPEGGFSAREAELAQTYGFMPVSLGTRILRAQTAALAAAAVVQYVAGDLG